jgi:hypothetical protein
LDIRVALQRLPNSLSQHTAAYPVDDPNFPHSSKYRMVEKMLKIHQGLVDTLANQVQLIRAGLLLNDRSSHDSDLLLL